MKFFTVALVLAGIALDIFLGVTASSLTFIAGLILVYIGERLFGAESLRWFITGGGLLAVLVAFGLRLNRWGNSKNSLKDAHLKGLLLMLVASLGLVLYGLTSETAMNTFGLAGDTRNHWSGILKSLFPILILAGSLPTLILDRALIQHPKQLPSGTTRRVLQSGLTAAFGIALVFPVNYLANAHSWDWDAAYFKVAEPGSTTLSIVKGLNDSVEVFLFYPPGSETREKIRSYFDQLEQVSEGRLKITYVDQAVDPKLAEELKIKGNGFIVFRQGENIEKYKLDEDLDKSRRDLKKLDGQIQKFLFKMARGPRFAYFLSGHGEASTKEKDEPLRKINAAKTMLESLNFKVKTFGVPDGSTEAIPEDAALLMIAAPETALLPEEISAVEKYLDRGGRVLLMTAPGGDPVEPLLTRLGLKSELGVVTNGQRYLSTSHGIADRTLIVANRYGSHAVVGTLAKFGDQVWVALPNTMAYEEIPGSTVKPSVLIRSLDNSWLDLDGDRQQQTVLEPSGTFNLAYAASGPATAPTGGPPLAADTPAPEWRALVFGTPSFMSDAVMSVQALQGNLELTKDALLWITGDDDLVGETNSEEDQKISHTTDQDVAWFYGTLVGAPLLVLAAGSAFQMRRRRK